MVTPQLSLSSMHILAGEPHVPWSGSTLSGSTRRQGRRHLRFAKILRAVESAATSFPSLVHQEQLHPSSLSCPALARKGGLRGAGLFHIGEIGHDAVLAASDGDRLQTQRVSGSLDAIADG